MADLSGFNPEEYEPGSNSFEPLPKGWYTAMITESENKETKSGDGTYLSITFEIEDERYKGRKVWANLNLDNPNPKAVAIAQRNLADICRATGVMAPKDSEDLHFKPLAIYLAVKEYNGELKNEVKGFKAIAGAASAPAPSNKKPAASAEPAAKKPPPWQRKAG